MLIIQFHRFICFLLLLLLLYFFFFHHFLFVSPIFPIISFLFSPTRHSIPSSRKIQYQLTCITLPSFLPSLLPSLLLLPSFLPFSSFLLLPIFSSSLLRILSSSFSFLLYYSDLHRLPLTPSIFSTLYSLRHYNLLFSLFCFLLNCYLLCFLLDLVHRSPKTVAHALEVR